MAQDEYQIYRQLGRHHYKMVPATRAQAMAQALYRAKQIMQDVLCGRSASDAMDLQRVRFAKLLELKAPYPILENEKKRIRVIQKVRLFGQDKVLQDMQARGLKARTKEAQHGK